MRVVLVAAIALAAMSFDARPVQAGEGPWCAVIAVGTGAIYEDCQYYSFEQCRPQVLAGNRGFCNPNPRWTGPAVKSRTRHKRKAQPS